MKQRLFCEKYKNKKLLKNLPSIILAVVGLSLLAYFYFSNFTHKNSPPTPLPNSSIESSSDKDDISSEQSSITEENNVAYPTDKLFITKGRENYKDGDMILKVPRLNLVADVLDGTTSSVLDRGVGLYDYAQLPGEGNRNVSITAHRNVEFEYIDTITQGDMIYLEYDGIEYSFEYEDTIIVRNDDWSIIYCKDHPVVTLISCHPVNSSKNRIAITAKLVGKKEIKTESQEATSSKVLSSNSVSSKATNAKHTSSKQTSSNTSSLPPTTAIASEPVPQSSTPKKANTVVLVPTASGTEISSNSGATIDTSNVSEGYVMVKYEGQAQKLKLQIVGTNSVTYTYNLHPNIGYETFPLTSGKGNYKVSIYENVEGTKYALLHSETYDVKNIDSFKPYLYPNQYVNFTKNSTTVKKGEELALEADSEIQVVEKIYNYVIENITYDDDKASSVKSGYVPSPDSVLKSGKGICFDYAAVMATMLRTQNIPTRLEVGYVKSNIYHAWISVYLKNKGWVNGIIQFNGNKWKLMDPTFASNDNSSKTIMQFIGNGNNYTTKYVY